MTRLPSLALALLLTSCAVAPPSTVPATTRANAGDTPSRAMVATAHPLATRAALDMLAKGGAPIDAAIAAQMVLGLVEPQSSGIGGGAVVMQWDAAARKLSSWDGLSAAPAKVTASLRTDTDGTPLPADVRYGGRSVGVPGTLPVLREVHRRHGKLPWADLFAPAIAQAEAGFPLPKYLHTILTEPGAREGLAEWRAIYFGADGKALPVGTIVRNPEYARTLRAIATEGPEAWLAREGARAIVEAAQRGYRPTLMTERDVLDYRPAEREPVCAPFLAWRVCTMAPASYGGILVLQLLQMTAARANGRFDFTDPAFAHLYAEAGKLAQADRRRFVGDTDFVKVPIATLVDPAYSMVRSLGIDLARANADPQPGIPMQGLALGADTNEEAPTTSQIAIADAAGNALAVTTTINLNFGARLAVGGFVLNNVMITFSAAPKPGETLANQMAPRKRPGSAMSPTIVFDEAGKPVVVGGSAGGGPIVDYIASSLVEMLANGRTPREALAAGHVTTAVPGKVQLERGTAAEALAPALAARGHAVEVVPLLSGLGFLKRTPAGWIGAADPRRDGEAMGLALP